ncbi:hypothetical protein EON65_38990 [archaeon]|nr:MAG: hypothetical protein EON65_38990 [archaeon]
MSTSLLEAHLKEIGKFTNPSKEKPPKKAYQAAKTPKGLPQPTKKVGRKRKLTSYIGKQRAACIIKTYPAKKALVSCFLIAY